MPRVQICTLGPPAGSAPPTRAGTDDALENLGGKLGRRGPAQGSSPSPAWPQEASSDAFTDPGGAWDSSKTFGGGGDRAPPITRIRFGVGVVGDDGDTEVLDASSVTSVPDLSFRHSLEPTSCSVEGSCVGQSLGQIFASGGVGSSGGHDTAVVEVSPFSRGGRGSPRSHSGAKASASVGITLGDTA